MSSTLAFPLEEMQQHIIAPDDSDFLDSEAESEGTPHPDDHLIESAVLEDLQSTPHRSSKIAHPTHGPAKLWPAHPLIRIHKRLWFTYFSGDLPAEDDLNAHDGMSAAWKNFDDDEIKKYVDPTETNPARLHWFNIDHDLVYLSFWFDWGPLNVAMFYRFCLHVHHMLTDDDMQDATLVLYTTDAPAQKANAALLATLYAMIIGKVSPADAFYPISQVEFRPFRDAGYGRADYNLSIQDVLYGVHRAINQNLLDLTTFNLDEYEKYEQVSNGDWNWITPNFIAFASPNDRNYVEALRVGEGRLPPSYSFRPPREDTLFGRTIRYFKNRGVKLVVRLNNPLYDRDAFRNENIDHCDMYFDDGSNPTDEILSEFIAKADKVIQDGGVVAVHCKAGLGRTGVLIGAYLAWKHGFSAGEAIGFMRFMRPGCVVGPQQHFMYQNSVEWIKWGVRDNAMKEAKQLIADERAKMEAAQAAAAAASAAGEAAARASVKRRAAGSEAAKGVEDDSFEAEIEELIEGFITAARRDHEAGFDGVDIFAGYNCLVDQFWSTVTNKRDDRWGGSLENRMRFPLEVFKAMRDAWPEGKPMAVRISANDWVEEDGVTPDEAVEIARMFSEAGADIIDVSAGQTSKQAKPVYGRMFQTPFSDRIRNDGGIKTMAVGNIYEADHVNSILMAGRADLVCLARPHLADPYWTLHAAAAIGDRHADWPLPYGPGRDQAWRLADRAAEMEKV